MNVLGIEIKGSDCICILLSGDGRDYLIADFPKKISLPDSFSSNQVKTFFQEVKDQMATEKVDFTAIKKRQEKGKFSGGALSFKMEGLIQLTSESEISFYSGAEINNFIKKSAPPPENLNKYQLQAFYTALKCLDGKS